ncbi:hypothetical protein V6N12_023856 [Hibiscus sabdariffa]|uniref:Barwin domain-containing protein n=1 Tax=Hibiscus sabdariffa TaxID=183260 RepID=A0ABR2FYX6_9ROSI
MPINLANGGDNIIGRPYVEPLSNWSYGAAACAALDGGKPLEWRQRYGWSGYCGNVVGSELKDICGKCLKVTNTDTKAEVIVRIVDRCGSGALELAKDMLQAFLLWTIRLCSVKTMRIPHSVSIPNNFSFLISKDNHVISMLQRNHGFRCSLFITSR